MTRNGLSALPTHDAGRLQRSPLRHRPALRRVCGLLLGFGAGLVVLLGGPGAWASAEAANPEPVAPPAPSAEPAPGIKILVDRPGVYALDLAALPAELGQSAEELRLRHHDRELPYWIEEAGPVEAGRRRLLFVAPTPLFRRDDPADARPLETLLLTRDEGRGNPRPSASVSAAKRQAASDGGGADELAPARRLLRFEEDVVRLTVSPAELDDLDSLWVWTNLTQQPSSRLEVDLGPRADRPLASDDSADGVEVRAGLVGWSRTPTPEGTPQHHVALSWNGEEIGRALFDGRRGFILEVRNVPADLFGEGSNRLRIKIPERVLDDDGEPQPLIDMVAVDWIEVLYPPSSPLVDGDAPLLLPASEAPRRLADPRAPEGSRLFSAAGWSLDQRAGGDWILPPSQATELWIVEEEQVRPPLAVEPLQSGARSVPPETDYLVVAPNPLRAGAERLAAIHRRLGRRAEVVDVEAIFDEFAGGERSAEAIRRFLDHQLERSGRLRWVLLVGDADFFEPDDRRTVASPTEPPDRNLVPTGTHVSRYGPAASDHVFAYDEAGPATPRFAVGRLPVVDPATLDAYASKLAAWIDAERAGEPPSVLLMRDSSLGSTRQLERQRRRIEELPIQILDLADFLPEPVAGEATDLRTVAIAALGQQPALVYFGGHGSRYSWQLGDPEDPSAKTFFAREDVLRLEPAVAQPIALSLSCATAPFDHPEAGSLGEEMVLNGKRGAVAFIGASAPLYTPPAFGEALVRNVLREETLGEAFLAAKRQVGRAEVSFLYSLLGDPGLPLDRLAAPAHRPEAEAGEQQDQ